MKRRRAILHFNNLADRANCRRGENSRETFLEDEPRLSLPVLKGRVFLLCLFFVFSHEPSLSGVFQEKETSLLGECLKTLFVQFQGRQSNRRLLVLNAYIADQVRDFIFWLFFSTEVFPCRGKISTLDSALGKSQTILCRANTNRLRFRFRNEHTVVSNREYNHNLNNNNNRQAFNGNK